MNNDVGRTFGPYRILRQLGAGGFAEVYLAEHVHLKTQVALKKLHGQVSPAEQAQFLREAQTLAALTHPHILRVLDFGFEDTTPYLIMDYASGGTLRDRYPLGNRRPLTEIRRDVMQIASALQYAHERRIIHRDIKPENLLLVDGQVVVSDFGIATLAHSTRSLSTQECVGTVTYMAPEQIRGKPRPASDQYALAVIVYEWLSGSRPFHGQSFIEIAYHHMEDAPPSLRQVVPDLPATVERVVMRALAKDPAARFPSIQAFATALDQACSQNRSTQKPMHPLREQPASCTRTRQKSGKTGYRERIAQRHEGPGETRPVLHHEKSERLLFRYEGHWQQPGSPIVALAWSPDGTLIASGTHQHLHVWTRTTGAVEFSRSCGLRSVTWSPYGTRLATGGQVLSLWHANGEPIRSIAPGVGIIASVAWASYGDLLLAAETNTVHVWDTRRERVDCRYRGHQATVTTLAWSPNAMRVASAGTDGEVHIWSYTGRVQRSYRKHSAKVTTLAWSPDSTQVISADAAGQIHLWEAQTGDQVMEYVSPYTSVAAVAWSPDGTRLAIAGSCSGSPPLPIGVWDVRTGSQLVSYDGHAGHVRTLAWSPDGTFLASGGDDRLVHIWQAQMQVEQTQRMEMGETIRSCEIQK